MFFILTLACAVSFNYLEKSRRDSAYFLSKYDSSGEMVVKIVHKMIFMRIVWKASHKDLQ